MNLQVAKKKFKSSKNRHLNYDLEKIINNLQQGGYQDSDNYKSISTISEFDKIREFLTREKEGQNGGNKDILDSDSLYDNGKKFTLFDIMKGGGNDDDDDDDDDDVVEDDKEEIEEEIEEVEDEDDDDDEDDDGVEDKDKKDSNTSADYSETSYKKNKSPLNVIPFYSSESSYRGGDSPSSTSSSSISSTSSEKVDMKKKYSDTSYSQVENSNYHPFYSTDSSDKIKHPYIKKRFN